MFHRIAYVAVAVTTEVAGGTFAPDTHGAHGSVTGAGTEFGGTITERAATPTWHRANGPLEVGRINTQQAEMISSKMATVKLPTNGTSSIGYLVVSIWTSAGYREAYAGGGVQVDVMNDGATAMVSSATGMKGGKAGTQYYVTLPMYVDGVVAGSASVPLTSITLQQYGQDGSAEQVIWSCTGKGSLFSGNVLATAKSTSGGYSAKAYSDARTDMVVAGGRTQQQAVMAIKATPGSSNIAPDTTPLLAGDPRTCNRPSITFGTWVVDHMTFVEAGKNIDLRFNKDVKATTDWTVPINIRVQYI